MPRSIKLTGIAPPDLSGQPTAVRQQYWQWVAEIALRVKDGELAQGLDATGEPLRPISAYTRKHRKTEMTPDHKGDPSAPPLMPARQKSRTRSLLAARAFPTHAELYWRYDPFTGDTWAVVLTYQRDAGRDVFGLSQAGMKQVRKEAMARWEAWKRSGEAPVVRKHAFPSYAVSSGMPQSRIAGIIAQSGFPATKPRNPQKSVLVSIDMATATAGANFPEVPRGATGGKTAMGWATHWREEAKTPRRGIGGVPLVPVPKTPVLPATKAKVAMAKAVKSPIEVKRAEATAKRKATIEAKRKAEEAQAKAEIAARVEKEARRLAEAEAKTKAVLAKGSLESGIAEAIRTPVNTMADLMAQRRAIAALLESYATEAGTGTYHGMTEPETFKKVQISGVELHFAEATDAVAKTAVTMMKTLPGMPEKFRQATRKVVITEQINKHEEYWNKTYNMPGSITGATGGSGEIVAYRDNELIAPRLAHEMGHNFAEALYGSSAPRGRYLEAVDSGEPPVSEYATKSPSEDFAETAKYYFVDRTHLQKVAPKRLAAFEAAMKGQR